MRSTVVSIPFAFGLVALGCSPARKSLTPTPVPATATVFTDSVLHAERCDPPKAKEDWRRVCTPRYQGVRVF